MFRSIRRFYVWSLSLAFGRSEEPTLPAAPPRKSRAQPPKRKSAPRPSPLAQAKASPVRKQPRRSGAPISRPAVAAPRPTAIAALPKRTPKPRHVWLSDANPPNPPRSADIIPLHPRNRPGSTGPAIRSISAESAKVALVRLLAQQIEAAA
jgi:hypothetical protein